MTTSPGNALDGKHVLVTGGSSGIGKACAERYRSEGATVYVTDIRPSSSDEIELDVTDSGAWAALVASLPPLDVVHLNAGITTPGRTPTSDGAIPLTDVTDEANVATNVAAAKDFLGGLNAAINCAGILGAGRVLGKDRPAVKNVMTLNTCAPIAGAGGSSLPCHAGSARLAAPCWLPCWAPA